MYYLYGPLNRNCYVIFCQDLSILDEMTSRASRRNRSWRGIWFIARQYARKIWNILCSFAWNLKYIFYLYMYADVVDWHKTKIATVDREDICARRLHLYICFQWLLLLMHPECVDAQVYIVGFWYFKHYHDHNSHFGSYLYSHCWEYTFIMVSNIKFMFNTRA